MSAAVLTTERRATLLRRVRVVVAITITWNVVEAIVALAAGAAASSAALIGFGLDSIVEVLSAAAVAWQFAVPDHERREKTALRVIAVSFFALAAYVTVDSLLSLGGVREAEHSTVGILLASLSLAVMPFLSWFERRTGRELGSASAVADSKQTLICTYLSAALLVGLLLNSLLGWAWADSVAALVIAGVAVREGINALRGDACCAPSAVLFAEKADGCADDCCSPAAPPDHTTYVDLLSEVPVACTLSPGVGAEQVAAWQALNRDHAASSTRTDSGLTVSYARNDDSVARLRALVAIERSCCSFVDWSVDASGDDLRLVVTGSPEQLDALSIGDPRGGTR